MKEAVEIFKVATVGGIGGTITLKLADYATIVSILVGIATLTYIVAKTYFLFRNHGKGTQD